jgi:spore coat protein U-like protein
VARTFNMDTVVYGGQDVTVGTYTDTVTATVNF